MGPCLWWECRVWATKPILCWCGAWSWPLPEFGQVYRDVASQTVFYQDLGTQTEVEDLLDSVKEEQQFGRTWRETYAKIRFPVRHNGLQTYSETQLREVGSRKKVKLSGYAVDYMMKPEKEACPQVENPRVMWGRYASCGTTWRSEIWKWAYHYCIVMVVLGASASKVWYQVILRLLGVVVALGRLRMRANIPTKLPEVGANLLEVGTIVWKSVVRLGQLMWICTARLTLRVAFWGTQPW